MRVPTEAVIILSKIAVNDVFEIHRIIFLKVLLLFNCSKREIEAKIVKPRRCAFLMLDSFACKISSNIFESTLTVKKSSFVHLVDIALV